MECHPTRYLPKSSSIGHHQPLKDPLEVNIGARPLNIQFRRDSIGEKWTEWIHLVSRLMSINLNQMPDTFQCRLTSNGIFTMKSMYVELMNSGPIFVGSIFGKLKSLLRLKCSCGFSKGRYVVLTKDNLAKRNWHDSKKSCFCHQEETIHHLFLYGHSLT